MKTTKVYIRNPHLMEGPFREPKLTGKWREFKEDGQEPILQVEVSHLVRVEKEKVKKFLWVLRRVEYSTVWEPQLTWIDDWNVIFTEIEEFECKKETESN